MNMFEEIEVFITETAEDLVRNLSEEDKGDFDWKPLRLEFGVHT